MMTSLRFNVTLILLICSVLPWIYCGWIIGALATIICIYACVTIMLLDGIRNPPLNSPEAFTQWKSDDKNRSHESRPTILCLGDSLTRGYVSANFTTDIASKTRTMVARQSADQHTTALTENLNSINHHVNKSQDQIFEEPIWVVNAGYNYVPSHVLLQEKLHHFTDIQPDYVLLLIGTNDILSIYHTKFQKEIAKFNSIDANILTMKNLEQNIKDIIRFLYNSSSTVQIGVSTIPPLGEDLNSDANRLVQQANSMIREIVSCLNEERICLVDIYEEMETILIKRNQNRILPSISINYYLILFVIVCPLQRIFSSLLYYINPNIKWWNLISCCLGNSLTHDGVHFNENAKDVVVESVMEWLEKRNLTKMIISTTKNR